MQDILMWILNAAFILTGLLMTFLILLQEGKGGGLAGLGGTKAAGVEGVTNPIRRATAWLSAVWFLLAIMLGMLSLRAERTDREGLFDNATALESTEKDKQEESAGPAEAEPPPAKTEAPAAKTGEAKTEPAGEAKTPEAKTEEPKTEAAKTPETKTAAPAEEKTGEAKTEAAPEAKTEAKTGEADKPE
ncbi:MAG: preprotein translocase subunit SecG [Planctomycetota bacterium]|nr:preprotein translocase subunit SecG [Planctomycetota bacterium]